LAKFSVPDLPTGLNAFHVRTGFGLMEATLLTMEHIVVRRRARGKFCNREAWEAIHADRFDAWKNGLQISEIAEAHQVSKRAVSDSIARSLARLPRHMKDEARRMRRDNRVAPAAALTTFTS